MEAFFGVLEDTVRTVGAAIEVGFDAVLDAIEDGDGAGGFGGGDDVLHFAAGLDLRRVAVPAFQRRHSAS